MPFADIQDNFLSRVETFAMKTQLDMNHNSITNLKQPAFGGEAATKDYTDSKLSRFGGIMSGDINMDQNAVTNLSVPKDNTDAATKNYVDDVDTKVRNDMTQEVVLIQNLLDKKIDIGEVDQKGQKIVNLGEPSNATDAATMSFVKKEVSENSISATSHAKDEFRYLMLNPLESSSESNIKDVAIADFANTPHKFNKKAYSFVITKSASEKQFAGRIE